jgi:hypothetical protein
MEKTNWQIVLSQCVPAFMTIETTGVASEDVVSTVSLRPPVVSAPSLLAFEVPEEMVERAAKFLNVDAAVFRNVAKFTPEFLMEVLMPTLEWASDSNMTPVIVTYNTGFQHRFFQSLGTGLESHFRWLDICKLCWCIENIAPQALTCDNLDTLTQMLDEFTNGAKKMGYKDTMTRWGVALPSPCTPQQKTERVEWLWNKISNWSEGANVWQLPYQTSSYPEIESLFNVRGKT